MPRVTLQTPEAVSAEMDHLELSVEGPEGSVARRLWYPDVSVTVDDDEVVIENFLGETAPRRTEVHGDTDVEVSEEQVTLQGPDIEAVGQTAADIEQLTRVQEKDVRVFQDGVYITDKPNRGGA